MARDTAEIKAKRDLRALVEKAIAGKGVSKSEALYRSAEAGDMGLVERLLEEGAAIEGKRGNALDAAATEGHEDIFKKLIGASSVHDHNDLRDLSSRCLSAEARQKLESLAMQVKAQGGHTAGLGIDGPASPVSRGAANRPQPMF